MNDVSKLFDEIETEKLMLKYAAEQEQQRNQTRVLELERALVEATFLLQEVEDNTNYDRTLKTYSGTKDLYTRIHKWLAQRMYPGRV